MADMASQESVNSYFEKEAAYWRDIYDREGLEATLYREREARVLSLVDRLNLPPQSMVLEVGCGAGRTTTELARRGFHVHAIDAVPVMVQRTQRLAETSGVSRFVEVRVGDARHLDFPGGHFSLVLAVGVLPWVEPPIEPLREMARVTRHGGHLILTVDNRWRLNHLLDPRCFPWLRSFRWKVREALEKAGWVKRRPPVPRHALYSCREFDLMISATGLTKKVDMTLGFGPFTLFNRPLFSETTSIKIHKKLQHLADRKVPVLRSSGVESIVLAFKP